MIRRHWKLGIKSACAAILLAAWGAPGHAVEMKIGFYPGAVMTIPSWIAAAKGFYQAEGIEPVLIPVANGPLMSSNTASGAIDIGYNSAANVGLTREQGLNQTIVLGNLYMPIVLIARNDLEIPNLGKYPLSIADLKGKNWGSYGRGSDIENIMRVMARDAGLNPDSDSDVVWIGVGAPPTGLPALKAGQIDVYGTTMPASEVAIAGGYGKMVVDLREGEGPSDFKGSVYSVLLALSDRVKKEPELFEKFKAAHTKTYCWLKDPKNFDEAASIIQSNMPVADLSPEQYRDLVKRAIGLANIAYDPATLDKWSDMMTAGGILKERIPHDVVWDQVPRENPAC